MAVFHSRLSAGERLDQWDMVRSGAARVVVGARSALFCPLADLGLIVIDEEHEQSYKHEVARATTRARWLPSWRSSMGAPCAGVRHAVGRGARTL